MRGSLCLFAVWISDHREEDDVPLVALKSCAITTGDAMPHHQLFTEFVEKQAIDQRRLLGTDQGNDTYCTPTLRCRDPRKVRVLNEPLYLLNNDLRLPQVYLVTRPTSIGDV